MFASSSSRVAVFFSASGTALSQELDVGKINVQSACALGTQYKYVHDEYISSSSRGKFLSWA
jgi:hypothetical protein